jgi:hypothetical protein
VGAHRLHPEEARRIAVRVQVLDAPCPTDLLAPRAVRLDYVLEMYKPAAQRRH